MAEEFLSKVKTGDVTHGILVYRNKDGGINYQLYSPEHLTYVVGMLERAKVAILSQLEQDT